MSRWRDDRGVTVQIGAVLLLAIVFAALALYQVNAVPAENGAIESEHNRQVTDELQDLRNAIRNVGTGGGTESVSVTLGTRYPTRTFLTNPSDPTGSLKTTGAANVTLENATFTGNRDDYNRNPSTLLERNHTTTTLSYVPDYNEYDDAPTTRIEHGLAYNEFDEATIPLTDQGLFTDGTIRLILLEGTLSETGRTAVSLDPTVISGPSDEVPITSREGAGNITLALPTRSPAAWNETIGTTFDAGEPNARVVGLEGGRVRIELAEKTDGNYRLQLARVGLGDSGDKTRSDDEYGVTETESDRTANGGAYAVRWNTTRIDADNDRVTCPTDGDGCTFTAAESGDTASMFVETKPAVDGATVEYAVSDRSIGTPDPGAETVVDGRNETDLVAKSNGTVTVYASSGGAGDRLEVTVRIEPDGTSDLPDGSVAYHDQNGNGAYDDGEPTYAEGDLGTVDVGGSLVVADDAFSADGMDITAGRLTVEDGVQLQTRNGPMQLTTTGGELAVAGTLDTTAGSGQRLNLDAAGAVTLSDGTLRSSGDIRIDSGGPVVADDASFDATAASYGAITVSGDDTVAIQRATVRTQGPVTVTAAAALDATAADIDVTGIGQDITLESRGDTTLDRATLDVGWFGAMTGDLGNGRSQLAVDGAEFRQNGDPEPFDYSPNGATVVGSPAVGSVS